MTCLSSRLPHVELLFKESETCEPSPCVPDAGCARRLLRHGLGQAVRGGEGPGMRQEEPEPTRGQLHRALNHEDGGLVILGTGDTAFHQKHRSEWEDQARDRDKGREGGPCLSPPPLSHHPPALLFPLPGSFQLCPTLSEGRRWDNNVAARGTVQKHGPATGHRLFDGRDLQQGLLCT